MDSVDEKYEEAIGEVAKSIDQYVGVVNDTSSKQYDDFNENLKQELGKNLESIQDVLNTLWQEVDTGNEKMAEIEKTVNQVDIDNQKRIDVVRDQVEIERLVNELVSWVDEEKQLEKFGHLDNKNQQASSSTKEVEAKADAALEAAKKLEEQRVKDREEDEKRWEEEAKQREEENKRREEEEKKRQEE